MRRAFACVWQQPCHTVIPYGGRRSVDGLPTRDIGNLQSVSMSGTVAKQVNCNQTAGPTQPSIPSD